MAANIISHFNMSHVFGPSRQGTYADRFTICAPTVCIRLDKIAPATLALFRHYILPSLKKHINMLRTQLKAGPADTDRQRQVRVGCVVDLNLGP